MNHFKKNIQLKNESQFRLFYVVCLFLSSICFIEKICWILIPFLMLWGAYFLWNHYLFTSQIHKVQYHMTLLLFIGAGIVTSFLNFESNLSENLFMIYHAIICFFLLYGAHSNGALEDQKKEIFHIFYVLTTLINVLAFLGLLFMLVFVRFQAFGYTIGLFDNRYTGFYTHPNIAAFTSVIGIIGCHLLCYKDDQAPKSYQLPKWFCITSSIIHVISIWIADSNASFIYVCIYFFSYYSFIKEFSKKNNSFSFRKLYYLFLAFILFVSVSYGLRYVTQNTFKSVLTLCHTVDSTELEQIAEDANLFPIISDEIEIGRRKQSDLSSGRLDSYYKALLLLQFKPILGTGKANIIPYGNMYLYNSFLFFDLHNGYLTILLSCGIIGFCLFLAFLLKLLKRAFFTLFHLQNVPSEDQKILSLLLASLLGYGVYSLFERTLLFDITFMVIIFWVLLSSFITYTKPYESLSPLKETQKNKLKNATKQLKNNNL